MGEGSAFVRFVELVKRELGADDVLVLGPDETVPPAANVVLVRLRDGRHVVASFSEEPRNREALGGRLAILAHTFAHALASPPSERTRARLTVVSSLHGELRSLAQRALALDAAVIDVDSPVLWACASSPSAHTRSPGAFSTVDELGPAPSRLQPVNVEVSEPTGDLPTLTAQAIGSLRALPTLKALHRGRHFRHVERETEFWLALSFSGIYVLCLVFDGPFDELRAERASQDALPRIARLVIALPPRDPEPEGSVIALRRARR